MLRHSLHISRQTRSLQINARLFGLNESLVQQERFKSSEAKVEQRKRHGQSRQRNPRQVSPRQRNPRQITDQVDPFADRWRKAMKGRQNPIDQERQNSAFSKQNSSSDGNPNRNPPKSWRTRLQEKARQQKANQSQEKSDVLTSFLNQRNQKNKWQRSPSNVREDRSLPDKKQGSPITDMKDVSALRAAFLKTIKKPPNTPRRQSEAEKPEWRQTGGAREYRKRMKQQQLAERRHNAKKQHYRNRYESSIDNAVFYSAKKEMDVARSKREQEKLKQQDQKNEKQILLPNSSVSVSALSSIFRVKIDELLRMLRKYEYREKSSAENEVWQNFPNLDESTTVDLDTMELIGLDLGLDVVRSSDEVVHRSASEETRHLLLQHRRGIEENSDVAQDLEKLQPRPPVVCIMGHVDHGKTTLMDTLRRKSQNANPSSTKKSKKKKKKTSNKGGSGDIAGTEAGGITQAISAFQVSLEEESTQAVTFLDTPGHAAFRKMRESGSNAADVICLVIAADDGVSAQTLEILEFYKSIVSDAGAAISLVVAMTKVDKPGINVDESCARIEAQLMDHGIMPESYGTTSSDDMFGPPVQVVPVSGITGEGVEELIESLTLQTEVMELRAISDDLAEGIVMDARVEKGIGVVVDCIVRWGSLKRGDVVVSGVHYGKVKALKDVNNAVLKVGVPSQPVRIVGFKSLPKAGDPMVCVESEGEAEEMVERRLATSDGVESLRSQIDGPAEIEVTGVAAQQNSMLQRIHDKYDIDMNSESKSKVIHIPVIIKADADATLSALREAVLAIGKGETVLEDKTIIIDVISQDIGPIDANDIQIAKESNAPILCFNIKTGSDLPEECKDVIIESHNVIYSLLDKAKDIFSERFLPKTRVEKFQGQAKIKAIFDISGSDKIAGLKVTKGNLFLNKSINDGSKCFYRVLRGGEVVSPGGDIVLASSLKRMKDDVQAVQEGEECGLGLDGYTSYEEGDTVECYSVEEQRVEFK